MSEIAISACERCGTPLPSEPRRGPRRKLCRACATPSTYNARWRSSHPDYVRRANAARRVRYEAIACLGCGLAFTPLRTDSKHCCPVCSYFRRHFGQPSPTWVAVHHREHLKKEAPDAVA